MSSACCGREIRVRLWVTHSLVHAGYAKRTIQVLDGRVVSETQLAA
jgi:hypothetical protein